MLSIKYYYDLSLKWDGISAFSKAAKMLMLTHGKEFLKFMTSNSCSVTSKDNSNLMLWGIKESTVRVREDIFPQYRTQHKQTDMLQG